MRRLLLSAYAWIVLGALLTILPMALLGEAGWVLSLAGLCLFSIANPLACALGKAWWAHTLISSFAWIVIFASAGQLSAMKALREGAMVFLLPMMIYLVAVPLSGLIRLVRWRRSVARARSTTL